ncbi:hypothetical protein H0H93_010411, partial [Arthromyces matolae]
MDGGHSSQQTSSLSLPLANSIPTKPAGKLLESQSDPAAFYRSWNEMSLESIMRKAEEDENLAQQVLREGRSAEATSLMVQSLMLRCLNARKLFRVDVAKAEIIHLTKMGSTWNHLKDHQVKFIGWYLSLIDRHSAYTKVLDSGNLPPFGHVEFQIDLEK